MKNLKIRPMGMVELDDAEYQTLYTPVTDFMFYLAQYAYSDERRLSSVKNALLATHKIEQILIKMSKNESV